MRLSIVLTAVFVVLMAFAAKFLKLLTFSGAIAATVIGLLTLFLGGFPAFSMLCLFFASSNLLGLWRKQVKRSLNYEKGGARDHWQVLANGGPALIGLLLSYVPQLHISHVVGLTLYAAGLAEANADTWATEIGSAISRKPYSIISGKIVPTGESGGVTTVGLAAAAAGSILIGLLLVLMTPLRNPQHVVLIVGIAGFTGAAIDSILGATLQAQYRSKSGLTVEHPVETNQIIRGVRWLRNDGVNFLSGLAAVLFVVFSYFAK